MRTSSWVLMMGMILATRAAADPVDVAVATHVDATPELVIAMLADFEAWGRIFGDVRVVRCERRDDGARIRQTTRLAGRTVSYTITATMHPEARRLEIALDPSEPSDLLVLRSTWQIDAHPSGGSQIALRVVAESGAPVPPFVERLAVTHTARRSINELADALGGERSAQRRVGLRHLGVRDRERPNVDRVHASVRKLGATSVRPPNAGSLAPG